MVDVQPLTVQSMDWDTFVRNTPGGSPFHLIAWKRVVETTFGQQAHYLMAVRGGAMEGVLPLFRFAVCWAAVGWSRFHTVSMAESVVPRRAPRTRWWRPLPSSRARSTPTTWSCATGPGRHWLCRRRRSM